MQACYPPKYRRSAQVEDARSAMDLFRSAQGDWENLIENSVWPALIPPREFERCYT